MKPILAILWSVMCLSAWASFNVYSFDNSPEGKRQAQQFQQLIQELRCPTCQNNNLADSNAPLATDIKNYVYQSVRAGQTSEAITAFLVSRYGEFITYQPRNVWLWVAPFALGGMGLAVVVLNISRRRKVQEIEFNDSNDNMAAMIRAYEQEKRHD